MLPAHTKNNEATTNISDSEAEDDNPPSLHPSQVIENVNISSPNNASHIVSSEMHKESNDDIFVEGDGKNGPSIKNKINQTYPEASDIILYKACNNDP